MPALTPALLFASVIVACWIAPTSSFVIRLQGAILGSGGSGTIWFVGLPCAGVGDTLVLRWGLLHPAQTRTRSKNNAMVLAHNLESMCDTLCSFNLILDAAPADPARVEPRRLPGRKRPLHYEAAVNPCALAVTSRKARRVRFCCPEC